jgi:hydroxymethylpyrimidine pyrophosphatase-like HAD family hydrolase
MNTETLPLADFIKDVLPFELHSRAKGRPIQIVSDFDETQSSTYVFSNKWNTHVPKIRADLSQEAQKLVRPMCLATARTSNESVSWVMWHKLSRLPTPLVAENGAVLVWPSFRVTQPAQIEILANDKQVETMRQIQKELQNGLIENLIVPVGHEVVLRPGRVATVEIRSQEISTKNGTPDDYGSLTEQLQELFPEALSQVEILSSGSSLGIQPIGVSKESGIRAALSRSEAKINDVFLVGIGDNKNDDPLFNFVKKNNGLTIGVRPSAGGVCDFVFDGGDKISLEVLKVINSL